MYCYKLAMAIACTLGATQIAMARPPAKVPKGVHMHMLHNIHVHGQVASSGKHGKHLALGIILDKPLKDGAKSMEATITHNEPPESIQNALGIHSGSVPDVATVDVTCPTIKEISYHGIMNSVGINCTLNNYKF